MKSFLIILFFPLLAFSQVTKEEINFINEVNLVRSNPQLYISYIEDYANNWGTPDEKKTAPEVIAILKKMTPIQPLIISCTIRMEMESHNGIDTANRWVNHGNWKWLKSPRKGSASENIIMSCSNTYRNMVIRHLIDANIPSRGHRKNILNPAFNTIAVKRIVFGDETKPFRCRMWWIEEYLTM